MHMFLLLCLQSVGIGTDLYEPSNDVQNDARVVFERFGLIGVNNVGPDIRAGVAFM